MPLPGHTPQAAAPVHRRVADLDRVVAALPPVDRALIERLFRISVTPAKTVISDTMRAWVEQQFGNVALVENQKVVRVTNLVTYDSTAFNPLRSKRPQAMKDEPAVVNAVIAESKGDDFCEPRRRTAEDVFGRVEGDHSISAANIARIDGFHGVLVFNEHNPLTLRQEWVEDYIMTARLWAEQAHQADSSANYFMFIWNCLWKAGASMIHGHAQMLLGRDMHYAKVERLRLDALRYRDATRRSYFGDLYNAHRALGLSADIGHRVRAFASLTPTRKREVVLMTDVLSPDIGTAIYRVLAYYRSLGVSAFNVSLTMPPLELVRGEDWSDFPVLARIVDRGNPAVRSNDTAALELYGQSTSADDPFVTAAELRTFTI